MSLAPWKPKKTDIFDDFLNFDHPFFQITPISNAGRRRNVLSDWSPAVDVSEDDHNIHVKADLPGVKKEDIHLSVDGSVVTIRGERKYEEEKKDKNVHRIERAYGSFQRSFDLGTYVDSDKIDAKYKEGVLELTVPKSAKESIKKIPIQ